MKKSDCFHSNYITPDDVPTDMIVTIIKVVPEEMTNKKGDAEEKPVAYFREFEKGYVLNSGSWDTIEKLYGPESDDWTEKRITLFATEELVWGERKMVVRIRMRQPTGPASAPRHSASAATSATAPPVTTNAQVMRREAWKAFQAARPGKDVDALTPEWQALLKSIGNGTASNEFTAIEWAKVKARAVPGEDPALNEPVFAPDDIPF